MADLYTHNNPRYQHGMAGTKIYNIWADMIARCERLTHHRYADYGGRGITVCARWHDFASFYADMGDRPRGRSLDRRDNSAGYSPENCRWATAIEQRHNRRAKRVPTQCGRGHPWPANLAYTPTGKRRCRACAREWARESRSRKRVSA